MLDMVLGRKERGARRLDLYWFGRVRHLTDAADSADVGVPYRPFDIQGLAIRSKSNLNECIASIDVILLYVLYKWWMVDCSTFMFLNFPSHCPNAPNEQTRKRRIEVIQRKSKKRYDHTRDLNSILSNLQYSGTMAA